ncbi:MAG: LysM peptidoglycan-binding domain-containing protein [Saprospiraceae bacterium]|nr:LysM peptidoglycan-binding domain-containing protein [Candidatus Opimibacter skivensis]
MHTVMKGDTLYGIARAYGLSVNDLKMKNNLSADTIFVGQN